ncbi:2-dehydro-3-deoxygluconate kinase [Leifsonia rubra CMS 76R]|nr:2-dehydro-3-deoxygluconate kinase [Leifsonia rubra CMS 76R]
MGEFDEPKAECVLSVCVAPEVANLFERLHFTVHRGTVHLKLLCERTHTRRALGNRIDNARCATNTLRHRASLTQHHMFTICDSVALNAQLVDSERVTNRAHPEIITLGETMVLITPTVAEPIEKAELFRLESGGAESNVAVHLAALGHHVAWASHLGADPFGRRIERQLRERGVDTSLVSINADAPTGFYFKDPGLGVTYHRAGSAASAMTPELLKELPVEEAAIIHISGITPALSTTCRDLVEAVFECAQHSGTTVSFDVNYRAGLWPIAEAAPVLLALAQRSTIVFVGLDEAHTLWNTQSPADVRALLTEPECVVVKDADVGATQFTREGVVFVAAHSVAVVESVGAGDAFAAGYLSGYLTDLSAAQRLSLGHERAVLVLQSTTDLPS